MQICTNTNTNTNANTETAHEGLPVDDEYKKPSINPLRKCVPNIFCLQHNFVNLIILCYHVLIFFGELENFHSQKGYMAVFLYGNLC